MPDMNNSEKNLEERIGNLEESIKVLLDMNQDQMKTILYELNKVERGISSLLFKQI